MCYNGEREKGLLMSDKKDPVLRYDLMVENALRTVVRDTLKEIEKSGLPGDHHFYITFNTQHPKVEIPDYLREGYESEMTIVLQYEFYDLKVLKDLFHVTLSFDDIHEKLTVPYAAVTTFADPSVNFALQFHPIGEAEEDEEDMDEFDAIATDVLDKHEPAQSKKTSDGTVAGNNIVALDAFRKAAKKPSKKKK